MRYTLILFAALASCAYTATPECDYDCTDEYRPVCSTEAVTYDNECWLQCDNARYEYTGACTDDERPED